MNATDARMRRMLSCLGDPTRFRIVQVLRAGTRCVTDLAHEVSRSQSCTTRHLQALEREGLVRGRRDGKRILFRVQEDDPRVHALLAWTLGGEADADLGLIGGVGGADLHVETLVHRGEPGPAAGTSRSKVSGSSGRHLRAPASGRRSPERPRASRAGAQAALDAPVPPSSATPSPEADAPRPARSGDLEDFLL